MAPDPVAVGPVAVPAAHLVGAGGALGALLRYWIGRRLEVESFPAATLVVNVVGTFALGLLTFLGSPERVLLFLGTGACGAFTTFSSFAYETVRLYETGRPGRAVLNAVGTLVAAGGALGVAWLLATMPG